MATTSKKIKPVNPYVNGTRVLVHGRLSYAHIWEPWSNDEKIDKKYQTVLLIPKDDQKSHDAVMKAIEQAKTEGIASKWGGKLPKKLMIPIKDGDDSDNESFHGYWYLNAKANRAPAVLDVTKNPITDQEKVYSGCWAVLNLNAFPYVATGNNGVSLGLNAVLKTYDDARLGGDGNSVADFDHIELPVSDIVASPDQVDDDDL